MRRLLLLLALISACATANRRPTTPYAFLLGIAQDGGYPQAGCKRSDCVEAWKHPERWQHVASLAIIDPISKQRWIVDATPDFPLQLAHLDAEAPFAHIDGIFLTHAHIGHYLGLAHLGREVMGAKEVPVYAMPRMREFLTHNGPWDQLVRLHNIDIRPLEDGVTVQLNERISITPLLVPHRDEYSETVGFIVRGPTRSLLWLPDIDKWEKWSTAIESVIAKVDLAFLDGTFFDEHELPGRSLSEVPHPTISESMTRFAALPEAERAKIHFVHLNQSNPALRDRAKVTRRGFAVSREGMRIDL